LLDEQKIAAAGKSLDEQYLGPDAKSSQTAPVLGPEPEPQGEPETIVKPENPKAKTQEAPPEKEQISQAAPPHHGDERSGSKTQEEEARPPAPQETYAPGQDAATASAPIATDGNYDRALELFKAGQYKQAADLFNEALAERSGPMNDCRAHYWLGHCLYGMGDFEAAIVQFNHSDDCEGASIEDGVLFMLGNCYLRLGDEQSANERYAKLLKDYPGSRFGPIASARTRALGQP
jgi:TolA-binding protein